MLFAFLAYLFVFRYNLKSKLDNSHTEGISKLTEIYYSIFKLRKEHDFYEVGIAALDKMNESNYAFKISTKDIQAGEMISLQLLYLIGLTFAISVIAMFVYEFNPEAAKYLIGLSWLITLPSILYFIIFFSFLITPLRDIKDVLFPNQNP